MFVSFLLPLLAYLDVVVGTSKWAANKMKSKDQSSACGGIVRSAKTKAAMGMTSSCSESNLRQTFVVGENAGRRLADLSTRFQSEVSCFSSVGA